MAETAQAVASQAQAREGNVAVVLDDVEQLQFFLRQDIKALSQDEIDQALRLASRYDMIDDTVFMLSSLTNEQRTLLFRTVQNDFAGLHGALQAVASGVLNHTRQREPPQPTPF